VASSLEILPDQAMVALAGPSFWSALSGMSRLQQDYVKALIIYSFLSLACLPLLARQGMVTA
jgi:hypothetical protein